MNSVRSIRILLGEGVGAIYQQPSIVVEWHGIIVFDERGWIYHMVRGGCILLNLGRRRCGDIGMAITIDGWYQNCSIMLNYIAMIERSCQDIITPWP